MNKKQAGESDIVNTSVSYFKIIGNHYLTPYVYYTKPNYRQAADVNMKGLGFNNTYIINEKNNINYTAGYSNTEYHTREGFLFKYLENNDIYSFGLKLNHNISNKNKVGAKLLHNITSSLQDHYSNDTNGVEFSYAHLLPIGTLKLSTRLTEKKFRKKQDSVSTIILRKDEGILNNISLKGQLNQLIPFAKSINKKNNIFYNINFIDSHVHSNIITNKVKKHSLTFELTKRLDFNGLFK